MAWLVGRCRALRQIGKVVLGLAISRPSEESWARGREVEASRSGRWKGKNRKDGWRARIPAIGQGTNLDLSRSFAESTCKPDRGPSVSTVAWNYDS